MSTIDMILEELISGGSLSTKQIRSRYNLSNPRNPIYILRQEGFPINLIRIGKNKRKYVLNSTDTAASTYRVVGH